MYETTWLEYHLLGWRFDPACGYAISGVLSVERRQHTRNDTVHRKKFSILILPRLYCIQCVLILESTFFKMGLAE